MQRPVEQREHLLEFYEAVGGSHYHVNYFRPGGVAKDVPPEIEERIRVWCRQFPAYVEELVAPGELDPDSIHLPGIYVHRIVEVGTDIEKRIERRTVSVAEALSRDIPEGA